MNKVSIALIDLYRRFLSPLKPPCCRFTPTCSQYGREAFEYHGFFKAFRLTFWRVCRCNPFNKGGVDACPKGDHHEEEKNKN